MKPATFEPGGGGRANPSPLSGSIWIEPQSGAVTKLVASMESTLSNLGFQAMRSAFRERAVNYSQIKTYN